ncbi:MAG: transglutaminase-like domain-containing protein, partial [Solirubrobacteraceae bacterium]
MSTATVHYLDDASVERTAGAPPVRLASMVIVAVAAIAIWWPTLGARGLWIAPIFALGGFVAAGRLPIAPLWRPWVVGACWIVWAPLVMLLTDQSLSAAFPSALGNGVIDLLRYPGSPAEAPGFAAWLTFSGGAWLVGADLSSRPGKASVAVAFFLLALPFAVGIPLLSHAGGAPWQGGAVLAAALLWATRGNLRGSFGAIAAVAVVAIVVSTAIGPKDKWDSLDRARHARSSNGGSGSGSSPQSSSDGTSLNTNQTYGPIKDDFTGADMAEIDSDRPALWRMQVLDRFDGRGWVLGSSQGDDLTQPGAVGTKIGVRILGLRDRRVMSPGRVLVVSGAGPTVRSAGEAVQLNHDPGDGQSFDVTAQSLTASKSQLEGIPIPTGDEYATDTAVFGANQGVPTPVTSVADRLTPQFAVTEMGKTILIASQLSSTANSELQVVENVENYLRGAPFRYSLDAPPAGNSPLLDFITTTHVGYCQHFAGAAALLLRMAGVPTRVATGFATGLQTKPGVFTVRDADAHAWIEVYFKGVGWVPFNPTPPAADAMIAKGMDPLHPQASGNTVSKHATPTIGDGKTIGIVLIGFFALGSVYWAWRARRGAPIPALGDVLVRLVPPPAGAATTHEEIRAELDKLGPSIAGLAHEAELERFGPPGMHAPERHPRRRVWRALLRDVGPFRAVRLMVFG